jgi:hypothetical protein
MLVSSSGDEFFSFVDGDIGEDTLHRELRFDQLVIRG